METVPLVERDKETNQSERKVSFISNQRSMDKNQTVLGPDKNLGPDRTSQYTYLSNQLGGFLIVIFGRYKYISNQTS